jgi:hypothetical protein
VREPADDPEDGVFRFEFKRDQKVLVGSWTPNNKNLAAVSFTLTQRAQFLPVIFSATPHPGSHATIIGFGHTG